MTTRIIIRLLIFVSVMISPILALFETSELDTCGNHTCDPKIIGDAKLHFKKNGCFCDSLCTYYKDCCWDYNAMTLPEDKTPKVKCRSPTGYRGAVMMVVSCPVSFNGNRNLKELCEKNSSGLYSSIPVTGRFRQLIYRNVYCALCNGEKNYTFWNQKLKCKNKTSTGNLTIDQVDHNDCSKSFQNPYPNTSHFCIQSLVKTCKNSSAVECETGNNAVVYSDGGIFYKNPDCFKCNKEPVEKLFCIDLPNEMELATLQTFTESSYFILINFNRRDVSLNGRKQLIKCPHEHWFNYLKGKCELALHIESSSPGTKTLNCSLQRLQKHEYTLMLNETLYYNSTNTFFEKDSYIISNSSDVFICHQHARKGSLLETWLTFLGMGISLSALTFLIVVYLFMPAIWNLTGMIYLSFSVSLFLAQIMFLISRYSSAHGSCHPIAITMHYAFLASFFWLNVVSVNIWITVCRNPCEMTSRRGLKRFLIYSLYSWLAPLAIVIPALLLDKHQPNSKFAPAYGYNGICWLNNNFGLLLFFAAPLAAIIVVNLAAYTHTAITIYKLRKFSVQNTGKGNIKILIINIKLCLLTGITWIFGYLASVSDSKELRIIFIILNATYGLWLAICFLTSENIFSSMKQKFRSVSHSTSTRTMT